MEAVVAIGVLITSVIIIIALSIATTDFGRRAERRNLATNLAREGMEIVRQKRDSNWLAGALFANGLFSTGVNQAATATMLIYPPTINVALVTFSPASGSSTCYSDVSCTCYTSGSSCTLNLDTNGIYSNIVIPGATATPYRRLVFIKPLKADGTTEATTMAETVKLHIVSQVYWLEKKQPQTVTLETDLYDWKTNNP